MLLRSMLMNSVAMLRAADGVVGGGSTTDAAPGGGEGGAAPGATPVADAAPAAAVVAPAGDAAAAAAPAGDAAPAIEQPKSAPSLLEAAEGKPKADAKPADDAAKPADGAAKETTKETTKKEETPAPADAAKPDDAKPVDAKDDKKPDAKKDDAKPDDAAKATDPAKDATAEIQSPAPVKYEAFKVPDGIKFDDKKLNAFTEIIGARQLPQEDAQKLLDLYVEERKADAEAARTEQRRVWDTLNDTWKTELRSDKELGGNRLETSLSMAKAVIEEYGGNPDQVRELLAHTTNNGMGNFPGFVRLLHNIAKSLNVFEDGIVPANPTAPKPTKGPGNRGWYDQSKRGGNGAAAS